MDFNGLVLKPYIKKALEDLNFQEFTNVQLESFKVFNTNKNFIVKAKTGSGKTHSYLIPIFNGLDETVNKCQALILAPTKELATQIYKVCQHIASFSPNTIVIKNYVGGTDRLKEMEKIESNPPQIVIGTPGKIKDLAIDSNILKVYTSKYFICDEVDMIYDAGFFSDMVEIAGILEKAKKCFFSATLNQEMWTLIKKSFINMHLIDLNDDRELQISHILIPIRHQDKNELLLQLMNVINPYIAIIFVNRKEDVMPLVKFLNQNGIDAAYLYGDMNLRERKKMVNEINNLNYRYVVASDLASRGIDIEGVSHIINYSLPFEYEFYVHRSGRTGRASNSGIVYSFYEILDDEFLDLMEKKNIHFEYQTFKNGELVEYRGRNVRSDREKPLTDGEKQALKQIKKPDKVTPNYKKKLAKKRSEFAKIYDTKINPKPKKKRYYK